MYASAIKVPVIYKIFKTSVLMVDILQAKR